MGVTYLVYAAGVKFSLEYELERYPNQLSFSGELVQIQFEMNL